MTRLRKPKTSLISLLALLVIAATGGATAKPLAASLKLNPSLTQTLGTLTFPLPTSVPVGTSIRIGGSSSMETINQVLKQRFEQQFVGTEVKLNTQGTGPAIKDLLDGNTDLAAIGRSLTEQEKAQGLLSVAVSRHKIAIIVGSENPFKGDLTFEQFAKIFRGEIKDWSQLGGEPGPIRFIDRPDNSDTRQAFRNYPIFKKAPFKTGKTAKQVAQDSTSQVVQALRTDGIGYAIADQLQGRGDVRVLSMNKTLPSNPKYPFSQPLIYVYKGPQPNPAAQSFLGFATAPASRKTIETARKEASTAIITTTETTAPRPKATVPSSPAISPQATTAPQKASPAPADTVTDQAVPWWLWLLGLPLLGGLLWWLLQNREAQFEPDELMPPPTDVPLSPVGAIAPNTGTLAPEQPPMPGDAVKIGGAPLAGGAVLAGDRSGFPPNLHDSRIILVPRDSNDAYAYWEVPDNAKESQRQQGGQTLALRLYDVTEGFNLDQTTPDFQQFDVDEQTSDQHLPIRTANRDYVVELGYVTSNDHWLTLARSAAVRISSSHETPVVNDFSPSKTTTSQDTFQAGSAFPAAASGAADFSATAMSAAMSAFAGEGAHEVEYDRPLDSQPTSQSQIFLVPRNAHNAYVHWDVTQADKDALKHQGGQQLVLRVYEVADTDSTAAYNVQQFLCHEWDQDQHVPIPVSNLDYIAELGYTTLDGRFLRLARSPHTRVPGS
jgi:phosphate transport system substrate-binding protein